MATEGVSPPDPAIGCLAIQADSYDVSVHRVVELPMLLVLRTSRLKARCSGGGVVQSSSRGSSLHRIAGS